MIVRDLSISLRAISSATDVFGVKLIEITEGVVDITTASTAELLVVFYNVAPTDGELTECAVGLRWSLVRHSVVP
nr:hypothetical protein [Natrinema sp. J7-1]